MKDLIPFDWKEVLKDEFKKPYFYELSKFISLEYKLKNISPKKEDIFKAFKEVSYEDIKVVIIGQAPYADKRKDTGLAYAVDNSCEQPGILKNIFKEVENDFGLAPPFSNLLNWSTQGVFLLNLILTARKDKPLSHQHVGWEIFTDAVISALGRRDFPIIFFLWGKQASSKRPLILKSKNYILDSTYPDILSSYNGFFGCKHFTTANRLLSKYSTPIDWSV